MSTDLQRRRHRYTLRLTVPPGGRTKSRDLFAPLVRELGDLTMLAREITKLYGVPEAHLTTACPTCSAPIGTGCTSRAGKPARPHVARLDVVRRDPTTPVEAARTS